MFFFFNVYILITGKVLYKVQLASAVQQLNHIYIYIIYMHI